MIELHNEEYRQGKHGFSMGPGECGVHCVICASSPLFPTKCSLL
jgi:hypothetical protein